MDYFRGLAARSVSSDGMIGRAGERVYMVSVSVAISGLIAKNLCKKVMNLQGKKQI